MDHDWQDSKLGHGNKMCRRCFATDLEAAALGMTECPAPVERTCDRLARELRLVAAMVKEPAKAAKYEAFAKRAETGEFDDYADTYTCPITQLHSELVAAGFLKFAQRVASGEFDATKAESDEWARSPSGQEAAKHLSPEMRRVLGLILNN